MRSLKVLLLAGIVLLANQLSGMIIHVPSDQPTIQAGIDAAVAGDTVLVADGTYTGDGNRDIRMYGKSIKLMSANGPESTIIDCEASPADPHRGVYFGYYESSQAVLDGFAIRNAYWEDEGGISCVHSHPTIRNCIVKNCGENGIFMVGGSLPTLDSVSVLENTEKGIYIYQSSPVITDCVVENNADGGMYCMFSNPVAIERTKFIGNTAGEFGGAIEMPDGVNLRLVDCLFEDNYANKMGGAIYTDFGDSITMTDCVFRTNRALWSGDVLWATYCDILATGCVLESNGSSRTGYVIHLFDHCLNPRFVGCEFIRNYGMLFLCKYDIFLELDSCVFYDNITNTATLFLDLASVELRNCTFSNNYVKGTAIVHCGALNAVISNCIIANTSGYGIPVKTDTYPPSLSCCDFFGNSAGDWVGNYADQLGINGNICLDPQFCDPESDDYRLQETSPCAPENNECGMLIGALSVGCHLCGDADGNGEVNYDDIIHLLAFIFMRGSSPDPYDAGDVDCSGIIDIDDVVYLIYYSFAGGPEPCSDCYRG